ncbi:MAG TPA: hypothetical protein VGM36_10525 [Rhizomicrobium sp.]|jgi:hypothetical protein
MQISSASLLAAQTQASAQPKPQASVFGSFLKAPEAKQAEPPKASFEPMDFAKSEPQATASVPAPDPAQAYRKPGSALDIRV